MNTKKLITDTMLDLLKQKSIEKISVKEILDRCELTKGTFYRYFRDKYDIINQYYERYFYNKLNKFPFDTYATSIRIYQFYFEHKTIIKNAIVYTGKNNLFDFTYDLLYDFYRQSWLNANKTTELPVELHLYLLYHCSGMISLYREIVLSKQNYDIDFVVSLALKMRPEMLDPFMRSSNFPACYRDTTKDH